MNQHKKRILIVNPLFRNLFMNFSRSILHNNFIVDEFLIEKKSKANRISKFYHKLKNLVNIHVFNKRDYYERLYNRQQNKYYKSCLKGIRNNKYDKIIFCRGDRIPEFVLQQLQNYGEQLINYQCDGVKICPDIFNKSKFFTSIYSFESEDILKYPELKLKFLTNFYFEHSLEKLHINYDFYYLGIGLPERIIILNKFIETFPYKKNLFMISGDLKMQSCSSLTLFNKAIAYEDNLENVVKSKCIIDLKMEVHNGLSFRFFEALYYRKKIITNNESVIHYDFYHPDNILIVNYEEIDTEQVQSFLERNYFDIDQLIVEKYSFKNWLYKILEIDSKIEIV